jgi:hypothetical protein
VHNVNLLTSVTVTHNLDGQAGASSICVSNPPLLPTYISSASISPSPPTSVPSPLVEQRLGYLHPKVQKHVASIIKLGDHFLREDVGKFLRLFCRRWSQTDLDYRPIPSSFDSDDTRMQNLFRRFYYAEAFRCRSDIDHLKYRFLRILLYHDFQELCIDIQNGSERYRGQRAASVATDKFFDGLGKAYGEDVLTRTEDPQRESFRKHKVIGRRWSILASHLGLGIFLTCSPELEAQMYDSRESQICFLLTHLAITTTFLNEGSQLYLRIYSTYILEEVS